MDIHRFFDHCTWFKKLFSRMEKLETDYNRSKSNPEILSIARGTGMLLIAILLGWLGKTYSENKKRDEVLNQEWPADEVWIATLRQGGWMRVSKSDFSNLLQNHPQPLSDVPLIWESDDHCLIFLTESPYADLQTGNTDQELWSCTANLKPTGKKIKWKKVGSGYFGVNQLAKIHFSKPKTASYIDPDEIRY